MRRSVSIIAATLLAAEAGNAAQLAPPTPLFAADTPLRFSLTGPIRAVASAGPGSTPIRPAILQLAEPGETHAVTLAPRGKSRRKTEICSFVPLSVQFTARPAPTSFFAGQRRLKLVTHCRPPEDFQRFLRLELAAYRMLNAVTPLSFRVRIANVDYISERGRPLISRAAFFIEDFDDVARRNGLKTPRQPDRVAVQALDRRQGARVALFQYMIGNLDWAVTAGPSGEGCCHNARLAADPARPGTLVPIPYDFDHSGLVNAPYAVAPEGVGSGGDVRRRVWRGHCRFNRDVITEAATFRERRGAIEAALAGVPGLPERSRTGALAYLEGFWRDIADEPTIRAKLLRSCLN